MPRYIISEGVIQRFLSAVFDSIINHKQQQIKKVIQKDPQLHELYSNLDAAAQRLQDYFNDQASQESPEFNKLRDYIKSTYPNS